MSEYPIPTVVIASGARTPVGLKCGSLSNFAAEDLATAAANEAIARAGINPNNIDAAIGSNVYQSTAPRSQDIYFSRNVGIRCGLPIEAPALLVQRICGSGIQTVINAFQQIALPNKIDDTTTVLCFGGETMTRAPQIKRTQRKSASFFWEFDDNGTLEDTMLAGLGHDLANTNMMYTADEYGASVGITRNECDIFAALSQERAKFAQRNSHLNGGDRLKGIFAFSEVNHSGEAIVLARDECVRPTSFEQLSKLPGFTPNKLVSAGNASEISDGGAAMVVTSQTRATELGITTRYKIAGYGISGVEPKIMGRGPVPSIKQALKRAGIKMEDVDLWEINEAFAAQYLGVEKELGLDRDKVNVNGGAIAIGHPLGATGARLLVDLMYEMERRSVKYGCASACIGGGQGVAIILEDMQQ